MPHNPTSPMDLRRVVGFIFCLFRFSFVVRMGWHSASSLHVELAIEVSINNLIIFISNIHHMGISVLGVKIV